MKIRTILTIVVFVLILVCSASCALDEQGGSYEDVQSTMATVNDIQANQPTPIDLNYSLERYNLIKRAYWVNGQREKAIALPCQIERPLGYIVLFNGNSVVGNFVVDGKVSSLNSYLTPDSEYYEVDMNRASITDNHWLADIDGSYGENDNGIFFFTPDGKYIEWTGTYLYSDIPFEVADPIVVVKGE